jgi:glycosyltransferase involved in cell wall biosynthesis
VHIHYLLTDLNGAGAALPVPELVRVMREEGHTVHVLALLPRDRTACARLDRAGISWELLSEQPRDFIGAARALFRAIDRDRPDLLWNSLTRASVYGSIAGWLRGIPVVNWQHNAWLKPGNRFQLRRLRRLTEFWVADSRTVAEFAATALDVPPAKIEVWPLFRARIEAPLAKPWAPGMRFRVGSLGRLHPDKNFCDLISAAALIRDQQPALAARLEFIIAGQGRERDALARQIAAARLDNVVLAGYTDKPDEFLASLHAYVQPSHHEGLCIAAHEAMQAALPVVATRVGEMQHSVIPNQTGALFDVGDVAALTSAIVAMAQAPEQAAAQGLAGRARILALFGAEAFQRAGQAILARAAHAVARRERQLAS